MQMTSMLYIYIYRYLYGGVDGSDLPGLYIQVLPVPGPTQVTLAAPYPWCVKHAFRHAIAEWETNETRVFCVAGPNF